MGSKNQPGKFDCYVNALPDEPMFVLLARDPSAPDIVRSWAWKRTAAIAQGNRPQSDMALVREARECADNMAAWRKANDGRWRASPPHKPTGEDSPHIGSSFGAFMAEQDRRIGEADRRKHQAGFCHADRHGTTFYWRAESREKCASSRTTPNRRKPQGGE